MNWNDEFFKILTIIGWIGLGILAIIVLAVITMLTIAFIQAKREVDSKRIK